VPGRLHPPSLRVGMACGPAAGAVIGAHRAFYCLYGDVINTAARMCQLAAAAPDPPDGVVASAEAAAQVSTAPSGESAAHAPEAPAMQARGGAGGVRCQPLAPARVKGKGLMSTFELGLDGRAAGPPPPARRRSRLRRTAGSCDMRWLDLSVRDQ
jgi:class 3 adenylate cyclase